MTHKIEWAKEIKIGGKLQTPEQWVKSVWCTLTDKEISEALSENTGIDVTDNMVTLKRQRMGLNKTSSGIPIIFQESTASEYTTPPIIETDNVLVISDIHAPFHDAEWCSEVVACAKRIGIDDCVIAGDLFDFAELSNFTRHIAINGDDIDVSTEIEYAASICDTLLSNFNRIIITLGNHEKRLSARAAVRIRSSLIKALLGQSREDRLEIYPYYYSIISSTNAKWRITHPRNFSVIPVRVAARLADKYGMNIIAAHGHDWGCSTSVSGRYAAACGCCADVSRLDYVMLEDNVNPIMQNGAWMLVRGQPVLLHPVYNPPWSVKRPRKRKSC